MTKYYLRMEGGNLSNQYVTEVERPLNDDPKIKHESFVTDVVEAGEEKTFSKKEEKLIALNRYRQIKSPCITVPPHVHEYECIAFHEINIISKLP